MKTKPPKETETPSVFPPKPKPDFWDGFWDDTLRPVIMLAGFVIIVLLIVAREKHKCATTEFYEDENVMGVVGKCVYMGSYAKVELNASTGFTTAYIKDCRLRPGDEVTWIKRTTYEVVGHQKSELDVEYLHIIATVRPPPKTTQLSCNPTNGVVWAVFSSSATSVTNARAIMFP